MPRCVPFDWTTELSSGSATAENETAPDAVLPPLDGLHQEENQDMLDHHDSIGRRLKSILYGVSAPFCCGGLVKIHEPVRITLKDDTQDTFKITPPLFSNDNDTVLTVNYDATSWTKECLAQQVDILQSLLDKSPPVLGDMGPQGPDMCHVKQLSAENASINMVIDTDLEPVLRQIKTELGLSDDIVPQFQAINIYEKSGKIAKHKDPPRGENVVGTLVLCLPSLFQGGALNLETGDDKHSYFGNFMACDGGNNEQKSGYVSWWPHPVLSKQQADALQVPWCAFVGGVQQEVEEVTSGVCVTLSFLLCWRDTTITAETTAIPRALVGVEQKTCTLVSTLREYLANQAFLTEGGAIAFPCEHLYKNDKVFLNTCAKDVLSSQAVQNLKGRDSIAAQAVCDGQLGLSIFLKPFVTHTQTRIDGADYYLTKFPDRQDLPRRMSDESIEKFFKVDYQRVTEEMADIWVANVEECASEKYGECKWNPVANWNEEIKIEFHIRCFLLVVIPSFEERRSAFISTLAES